MKRPSLGGLTAIGVLVLAIGAGAVGGALAAGGQQPAPGAPVQVQTVAEEATAEPTPTPTATAATVSDPAPIVERNESAPAKEEPVTQPSPTPETTARAEADRAKREAERAKAEADRAAAERAKAEAAAAAVTPSPRPSHICTVNDVQRDPMVVRPDGSYTVGEERICKGDHWFVNTPALDHTAMPVPAKNPERTMTELVWTKDPSVRVWFSKYLVNDATATGEWKVAPERAETKS